MAYLWFFGCFINQHQPRRRGTKWDGLTFVANCRHCGKPIARISPKNWQLRKTDAEAGEA
jgi:hypothetical protein